MQIIETIQLSPQQKQDIVALWNAEYPARIHLAGMTDFEAYLATLQDPKHLLLTSDEGHVSGWCFTFFRDNERWFAIILSADIQKMGYGGQLLNKLKETEDQLSGWVTDHNYDKKSDGSFYMSPLSFYLKNGFTVLSDCRLESDKIAAVKIRWDKQGL